MGYSGVPTFLWLYLGSYKRYSQKGTTMEPSLLARSTIVAMIVRIHRKAPPWTCSTQPRGFRAPAASSEGRAAFIVKSSTSVHENLMSHELLTCCRSLVLFPEVPAVPQCSLFCALGQVRICAPATVPYEVVDRLPEIPYVRRSAMHVLAAIWGCTCKMWCSRHFNAHFGVGPVFPNNAVHVLGV